MSIEADLTARLLADAAVSALIGARVFPRQAPEGTLLPYLIYERMDLGETADTLDGLSVHSYPMRIEAHASTYKGALALAAAVKTCLHFWRADYPATLMSMAFAGEFDGPGDYDEAKRLRRSHCREQVFTALARA